MKLDFFKSVVTGLVHDLRNRFRYFAQIHDLPNGEFPVYIMHSGDESFTGTEYDFLTVNKAKIAQVPRMVLSVGGVSIEMSEITSPYSNANFVDEQQDGFKSQKSSPVNVIPIVLEVNSQLTFTDVFQYFHFLEYLLDAVWPQTFYHIQTLGKENLVICQFGESFQPTFKNEFSFDTTRDNYTIELPLSLQFHFFGFGYYSLYGGIYDNKSPHVFDTDNVTRQVRHNTHVKSSELGVVESVHSFTIPKTLDGQGLIQDDGQGLLDNEGQPVVED